MSHADQVKDTPAIGVPDENALEQALILEKEKLETRINELQAIIEKANQAITDTEEVQRPLLRRLANVCELLPEDSSPSLSEDPSSQTIKHRRHTEHVKELAKQILGEKPDQDMHYKDLAKRILALGGELRGQDPALTLVALISPDPEFTRPNRKGHYALTENFPHSRNVGERVTDRNPSAVLPEHRAPYVG